MLKANIKTNAKQLQKKYKRLEKKLPRLIDKGIQQAGFQLVDIIRTKTKKGIDYQDSPFAPYSEGYLKQLQKEGKPTVVDLWYSGDMLGALTPSMVKKTGRNKATLAFTRKSNIDKAFFNQVLNEPKREFFGFNQRTESIIQRGFNKFMIKQLNAMRI
jgi:CRISPR/Cas system CMR-associated protein Cmr5 small subunit